VAAPCRAVGSRLAILPGGTGGARPFERFRGPGELTTTVLHQLASLVERQHADVLCAVVLIWNGSQEVVSTRQLPQALVEEVEQRASAAIAQESHVQV
jgi:hypothetical protein